jgi:LacI family transcriptional regulator
MSIVRLAQALNLSVSTVSRALNGYSDVAPATRQRVEAMAREMNYRPNVAARRLVSGTTRAIGVTLPTLEAGDEFIDWMYSGLLAGVTAALDGSGYYLVATSAGGRGLEAELALYRNLIEGNWADALLIVRTRVHDPRVQLAQEAGIPFVTYGRTETGLPYSWVDPDNEAAFALATNRQLGFGHRRIALIDGPDEFYFSLLRRRGYEGALAAAGVEPDAALVRHGNLSVQSGYALTMELLNQKSPPTSILCAVDNMAFGAIAACRQRGLVVGRDISVMGYSNSPMASYSNPELTTLEHRVFENGRHVGESLLRLLGGEAPGRGYLEPVQLVPRASDGPLRAGGEG